MMQEKVKGDGAVQCTYPVVSFAGRLSFQYLPSATATAMAATAASCILMMRQWCLWA